MNENDPKWLQAIIDKFSSIKSVMSNTAKGDELKARDFAQLSDDDEINTPNKTFVSLNKTGDKLRVHISDQNNGNVVNDV